MSSSLIFKEESYAIMGACFNVYKEMGAGFSEAIYHECLEIEFEFLKIPFRSQAQLPLTYRNRSLRQKFQPDFVCFDKIVLEIKAVPELMDAHRSQGINYLYAAGLQLCLLVNFGAYPKVEYERLANTMSRDHLNLNPSKPAASSDEEIYF